LFFRTRTWAKGKAEFVDRQVFFSRIRLFFRGKSRDRGDHTAIARGDGVTRDGEGGIADGDGTLEDGNGTPPAGERAP
jgi:hypothetical protein